MQLSKFVQTLARSTSLICRLHPQRLEENFFWQRLTCRLSHLRGIRPTLESRRICSRHCGLRGKQNHALNSWETQKKNPLISEWSGEQNISLLRQKKHKTMQKYSFLHSHSMCVSAPINSDFSQWQHPAPATDLHGRGYYAKLKHLFEIYFKVLKSLSGTLIIHFDTLQL